MGQFTYFNQKKNYEEIYFQPLGQKYSTISELHGSDSQMGHIEGLIQAKKIFIIMHWTVQAGVSSTII